MTINRGIARKGMLLAATGGAAIFMAAQANAAAFYIQEQSTKAVGRAFSGEVSERGAQQLWWNPAAIGGIDTMQGYAGFSAILPRGDVSNRGTTVTRPTVPLGPLTGLPLPTIPGSTTPVGGSQVAHNPIHDGYLPNGGFAIPLGDKLAVGMTVTSPFSFTTRYGPNSWARYSADKSRLRTLDFQPTIAFSPTKSLSIGVGPNIEYVRATLSNYLPDPLPPLPIPGFGNPQDGHQYLKGSGWNVGFSVGAQYHNDLFDLGIAYKSKIKHTLSGHLIVDGLTDPLLVAAGANKRVDDAQADFSTPWQLTFGGRVHLSPQFTLNGQITRFGWSEFDAIRLSNLGSTPDQTIPENYRNTWAYSVGFDYQMTPAWTLRAGVQRDLSPIPDGSRDPRVPDGNRWNFGAGTSYALNSHFTLDGAFSYDKIKGEHVDKPTAAYLGTPLATIINTDGQVSGAHAIIFSIGGSMSF